MRAAWLNCTLKAITSTISCDLLLSLVMSELADHGVSGQVIRVVDHDVNPGVTSEGGSLTTIVPGTAYIWRGVCTCELL